MTDESFDQPQQKLAVTKSTVLKDAYELHNEHTQQDIAIIL